MASWEDSDDFEVVMVEAPGLVQGAVALLSPTPVL